MEQITTLTSAWIFDPKGNIKQVKNQNDRPRAKQIYLRAKEALRYSRVPIGTSTLRRISFVNGKKEWTITVSAEGEIIVMQKDESLA